MTSETKKVPQRYKNVIIEYLECRRDGKVAEILKLFDSKADGLYVVDRHGKKHNGLTAMEKCYQQEKAPVLVDTLNVVADDTNPFAFIASFNVKVLLFKPTKKGKFTFSASSDSIEPLLVSVEPFQTK